MAARPSWSIVMALLGAITIQGCASPVPPAPSRARTYGSVTAADIESSNIGVLKRANPRDVAALLYERLSTPSGRLAFLRGEGLGPAQVAHSLNVIAESQHADDRLVRLKAVALVLKALVAIDEAGLREYKVAPTFLDLQRPFPAMQAAGHSITMLSKSIDLGAHDATSAFHHDGQLFSDIIAAMPPPWHTVSAGSYKATKESWESYNRIREMGRSLSEGVLTMGIFEADGTR